MAPGSLTVASAPDPARQVARITGCRLCGSSRLRSFLDLGELPLSDGLIDPARLSEEEPRFPLEVALCAACSLVQILHTVPPEALFGADYPYFSSYSDTLVAHARMNVRARIGQLGLGAGSLALEIASNDGYLLRHYQEAGIPVLGIDPAPGPAAVAEAGGIPTRVAFFGQGMAAGLRATVGPADVIHANNVLAHVADTNGFVAGIGTMLAERGEAVIEVPYLADLIAGVQFDTIYHEHLCYFSGMALDRLFRRNGLHLNRIERLTIHGGSLRLFVGHHARADGSLERLIAAEQEQGLDAIGYYDQFATRVTDLSTRLRRLLAGLKGQGARIAGYGAAAKGTILLNVADIGSDVLDYVVDRNPHKQGRWMPGVRLPIAAPERLLADRPDYVLILPWNFKDEIIAQQADYRAGGGRFIVPVPDPVIV